MSAIKLPDDLSRVFRVMLLKDAESSTVEVGKVTIREYGVKKPMPKYRYGLKNWESRWKPDVSMTDDTGDLSEENRNLLIIPPVVSEQTRKRVAAYCRVSTLLESQETSIKLQRMHYEKRSAAGRNGILQGFIWKPA